jgi:hypothetical protein
MTINQSRGPGCAGRGLAWLDTRGKVAAMKLRLLVELDPGTHRWPAMNLTLQYS